MEKRKDLRIVKTQKALSEALLDLMKDKSFDEIKVSDICNKALVNRSTFYSHYTDKYEFLVDFIDSLKSSLAEALNKNENTLNTKEYYIEMIRLLLNYMENKRNVFYSMIQNNRNSMMSDIIIDVVSEDVKKRIEMDNTIEGNIPSEIVSVFYLGAVTSTVALWLRNSHKYTEEEIITYLTLLIPDNIKEF